MSQPPLTPTRKKQLEAYIACIKRREMAIRYAGNLVLGVPASFIKSQTATVRYKSLVARVRTRGYEPFAEALQALRLARSKFTAELEGLGWHV